ncbi:HAD-IA family hydrolase [Pseudaestuariivita sp.]|uniref:HAD-IA family hydrolase n=1 Tax=Pseudaestuariivita sp. TaxID=2211669 RepID=UPI0040592BAF
MSGLSLVLFDVDGTLVDSQADIVASMEAAFARVDLTPPTRADILGIVGLSLPQAISRLAVGATAETVTRMVDAYKAEYMRLRQAQPAGGGSPLYPGIRGVLDALAGEETLLLGTATGKSLRGLDALVDGHGIRRHFVTLQCADDHPSKPHPSMILAAMAATGVTPAQTVMIGDTSFDMEMAAAAGVTGLGVAWGYHPRARLSAATDIVAEVADLPGWIERWRRT